MPDLVMTIESFETLAKDRLGEHWDRARSHFVGYGAVLSVPVASLLLAAADQEKSGKAGAIEAVLDELAGHWNGYLSFQHPDVRGRVVHAAEGDPTADFLKRVTRETLGPQA